jgi:hypothetical protein
MGSQRKAWRFLISEYKQKSHINFPAQIYVSIFCSFLLNLNTRMVTAVPWKWKMVWICFEAYSGAYPCHYGTKLVCSLVINLAPGSQSGEADARTCWCESKSNPRNLISNGHFMHKLQKNIAT